jgi:arylsulfatase A-like enzyme
MNTPKIFHLHPAAFCVLIAVIAAAVWFGPSLLLDRERPNVLLIVVDTLRADRLSCYGWEERTSPNIDALAAEGVLAERMVCQVPQTLPSFCSILTGSYPITHGVRVNGLFALPEEATTLAEVFAENGYTTAAFIAGFPLDSQFGTDQGFQTYSDRMRTQRPMEGLREEDGAFNWLGYRTECFENTADVVTDEAVAWLERQGDEPFFAMVHYFDPHHDYEPPQRFGEAFAHPYSGEVAFVDEQVGRLLDTLDVQGLDESTAVVFTADHGECLGEYGRFFHQSQLVDASLRIPFVARLPGKLPAGARAEGLCLSVDIMPTILDIAGIDPLPATDGNSVLEGLHAGRIESGPCYFETLYGRLEAETGVTRLGIAEGKWKYIYNERENPRTGEKESLVELYDMHKDPDELDNLAPRLPGEVRYFQSLLHDFLRDHPEGRADVLTPDESALEKLRRLGYF